MLIKYLMEMDDSVMEMDDSNEYSDQTIWRHCQHRRLNDANNYGTNM